MGQTRSRLDIDLEKSTTPGSILVTNSSNEAGYLPPGTNGQILTIASGVPTYSNPAVSLLGIYYGSYEITATLGALEYTIPYTATVISHAQVTQVKNSDGGGYYSDYIIEVVSLTGIKIIYDVQPTVGQKIKFNYLIIK